MSAEDYAELERLFCGSLWRYDRGENIEEFLNAADMPDSLKGVAQIHGIVSFTREGEDRKNIRVQVDLGEQKVDVTYRLNETIEYKANPIHQIQVSSSFKDGVFIQDVTPLTGGEKRYIYKMSIKGDELISDIEVPDVPGVTARRIYTRMPRPS